MKGTLIFDFGNTLAPFNAREADAIEGDLSSFVASFFQVSEGEFLRAWREEKKRDFELSAATGLETDFSSRMARALASLSLPQNEGFIREAEEVLSRSFVQRVRLCEEVAQAVKKLHQVYSLAVLSNYLLSSPIHDVLRKGGLYDSFAAVVVSREIGYAKPHPRAFEETLKRLGRSPEPVLVVGDDFEIDVEGALGYGLWAAWTWALADPVPQQHSKPLPPKAILLKTKRDYLEFLQDPLDFFEKGKKTKDL